MRNIAPFLYEWKHFLRSPFKVVALLLFVVASIYGLHNGASLYEKQSREIEKFHQKAADEKATTIGYFDKGEKGPKDNPRVDVTHPFWAIWSSPSYHFKTPSPALVYSIGQAEQYGFIKK